MLIDLINVINEVPSYNWYILQMKWPARSSLFVYKSVLQGAGLIPLPNHSPIRHPASPATLVSLRHIVTQHC